MTFGSVMAEPSPFTFSYTCFMLVVSFVALYNYITVRKDTNSDRGYRCVSIVGDSYSYLNIERVYLHKICALSCVVRARRKLARAGTHGSNHAINQSEPTG